MGTLPGQLLVKNRLKTLADLLRVLITVCTKKKCGYHFVFQGVWQLLFINIPSHLWLYPSDSVCLLKVR